MRLICPNCDAQYNVADDAIPDGGRDVQCSSCAHTWFQTEKPVVAGRDTSKVVTTSAKESPAPDGETLMARSSRLEHARKPLESSVADILREEASRDARGSSRPESAPPQTQTEVRTETLDVDQTRKRIAQMTEKEGGTRAGTAAASIGAVTAEANLRAVPSINEINAALRARAEASDTSGLTETEKQEAVERRGFRGGFFLVIIVFAILITPYFFADQITQNLPQTRDYMETYISTVDQARLWLSTQFASVFGASDTAVGS